MNKLHVKTGDTVVVISGDSKGTRGKVIATSPEEGKVIVAGANIVSKHTKARKQGENSAIIKTESVVTSAVEAVGVDTLKVTYARKSEAEELIHKLIHSLTAKSNLNTDLHALTELEVSDGFVSVSGNCKLTGDKGDLFDNLIDNLGVFLSVACAYVDDDLVELGDLHHRGVVELLHECGSNFVLIFFRKS